MVVLALMASAPIMPMKVPTYLSENVCNLKSGDYLSIDIQSKNGKEVILATSVTIEGEATANYIAKELEKLGIKATRIAKGIPVGGKFDYIDAMTMQNAIDKREEM